jgi:hypothetical protein
MDFTSAIQQPVTVVVGVILLLMAGMVAVTRIPIQLTPNVEDTIIRSPPCGRASSRRSSRDHRQAGRETPGAEQPAR